MKEQLHKMEIGGKKADSSVKIRCHILIEKNTNSLIYFTCQNKQITMNFFNACLCFPVSAPIFCAHQVKDIQEHLVQFRCSFQSKSEKKKKNKKKFFFITGGLSPFQQVCVVEKLTITVFHSIFKLPKSIQYLKSFQIQHIENMFLTN